MDGKVFNLLVGAKGETFPLAPETLERGATNVIAPNKPGLNRLPSELGGRLVGDGSADLQRNSGADGLQRPAILLIVNIVELDGVPKEARL